MGHIPCFLASLVGPDIFVHVASWGAAWFCIHVTIGFLRRMPAPCSPVLGLCYQPRQTPGWFHPWSEAGPRLRAVSGLAGWGWGVSVLSLFVGVMPFISSQPASQASPFLFSLALRRFRPEANSSSCHLIAARSRKSDVYLENDRIKPDLMFGNRITALGN